MHDEQDATINGPTGSNDMSGGMATGPTGDRDTTYDFVQPPADAKPQEEREKKKRSTRLTAEQKRFNSKKRAYESRKKARQRKASLGS